MLKAILIFLLVTCPAFAQGRIDCGAFSSRVLHRAVRYCVMLPPEYEKSGSQKYPVLYFLHGLGENEQTLLRSGGWGLIQDLQRQNRVGDFLMVAPEGRASFFINAANGGDRYSDFFISEFLPYVETHYRAIRSRATRGVTGLSMGGYGALRVAFAHPELFGSVSVQSAALITESPRELNADLGEAGQLSQILGGVFGNPIDVPHWQQNSPFALGRKNQIQIRTQAIYINCGQHDDFGFETGAAQMHKQLQAQNIRHEFHLYPGNHGWEYMISVADHSYTFLWSNFHTGAKPATSVRSRTGN